MENAAGLLAGLRPGIERVWLPRTGDGLAAMAQAMAGRRSVGAIHILSHGHPGALKLCGATVDRAQLTARRYDLQHIRASLDTGAEVLIYGCSVAKGDVGAAFLAALARELGCPVRGCDRPVGGSALGGAWPQTFAVPLAFGPEARDAYPALLTTERFPDASAFRVYSTLTPYEEGTVSVRLDRSDFAAPLVSSLGGRLDAPIPAYNVDLIPPRTLAPPDLVATSDLGMSSSDNVTSSLTQEFTGSAETGDIVSILVGGVTANTVTAVGGSWTYTHTLTAGSYAITVQATDAAGNVGARSSALGLVIDTWAPPVALKPDLVAASDSGSSSVDNVTNSAQPTISGLGGSPDGLVHVLVNGVTVGSAPADILGNWAYTFTSPLPEGANVITVVVSDVAGNNAAPSTGLTIVVDTTAPVLAAPDLLAASDTGVSSTDNITSSRTHHLTGSAADGDVIRILVDGRTANAVTAHGGSWSYTHTLGPGSYEIAVQGRDLAGNVGAVSPTLSLTVDTTAPGMLDAPDLLAASDTGVSSIDNITRSTTQQLSGNATSGDLVSVLVDGATVNTVTAADGVWSSTHALGDGTYEIAVQATDPAGNTGPVSPSLSLTVDTTAPADAPAQPDLLATSDTGASATDNLTSTVRPTITGTGAVPDGLLRILLDGGEVGVVTANAGGEWTFTFTQAISDGTHTVTAVSEDLAGNGSPASAGLSLQIDTTAAAPGLPDLHAASDTGLSSDDNITTVAKPTIQGSGVEGGARVHILDDGVTVGSVTATEAGTWSYTFASNLSEGTNAITVVQADLAGNASSASSALAITVDTSAPGSLAVPDLSAASDTGVSSSDDITSATRQILVGSADPGDRVHVIVDGVTSGTVVAVDGSWSYALSLTEGSYAISLGVTDAVGNVGPASGSLGLVVDTTAPAASGPPDLMASSDRGSSDSDNLTSLATPTFTGTGAVANARVHVLVDGTTVGSTVAGAGGAWTFVFSDALTAGSHAISVVAEDLAGNEAAASQSLTVEIDLTAPAAPDSSATPDLLAASDDGASSTDNVTTVSTPGFSGTSLTGSTMHALLANGVTIAHFVSQADGTYQVTASSLAPGSYAITVRELDAAGNVSADSAALNLTIAAPPVSGGGGSGGSSGGGGGGVVTPPAPPPPVTPTPVPATTNTTTVTTTSSGGVTVTTQTQTIQNPSATGTASAAIVQSAGSGGNAVTATLPAQTSIIAEGPSSAQTPGDALSTLIAAAEARQSGSGTEVAAGLRTFMTRLEGTAVLDVRTIIPTTTSTSLSTPIVITGTPSADGGTSEAFVIDVRSLPAGSTLQLDNIEFASIIGSATVNGGGGNNFATGDSASQFISLGEGDDTLLGGDGDDTIGSGTGDDSLDGEGGNDRVFGGLGNDTVIGSAGDDVVYGNQQADVLYGNLGSDTLFGGQDADTLFGGRDGDVLYGNVASDSLSGQVGDDTLYAGQGDDLVRGGDGNDRLLGNRHNDTLSGGSGEDALSGGADADVLHGGTGDDRLDGGDGDDTLYGGAAGGTIGIDVLDGGAGNDVLVGGAGVDWIYTGTGRDAVYIEASNGFDVIVDFDAGAGDVVHIAINVNGSGLVSFAAIRAAARDNMDGEVEIDLGSNNYVRVMGMTTAQLTSDMFQFF